MARTPGARDTKPRQKRTDNPCPIEHNPSLPEGYNTKRIAFMLAITPTEPLDYDDVAEMERRFMNYLKLCAEWDMKVGNQAAYAAIGIDKNTAWDWANKTIGNPARSTFIKKVQQYCATYREGLMEDGKVNPVTGIFWQKNYDGMKDQQEVVLTPNASPLGEQKDAEALKQKYLENTYGVAEGLPAADVAELPESTESPSTLIESAEGQKAKAAGSRRKAQKAHADE